MQTSLLFNKPIKTSRMPSDSDNINDFGNRVKSCRMEDDSMQSTAEPCEVMVFVDCEGRVLTPSIYVFTGSVFGRSCLFIKQVEPLSNGTLKIISDSLHYQTFTLNTDEQKDMCIHERVTASLTMRHFI